MNTNKGHDQVITVAELESCKLSPISERSTLAHQPAGGRDSRPNPERDIVTVDFGKHSQTKSRETETVRYYAKPLQSPVVVQLEYA